MILNKTTYKKVFCTLLTVCFAISVFAKDGGGTFYVKKGTTVSGLDNVSVKATESKNKGFYIKKGTTVSGLKNVVSNTSSKNKKGLYIKAGVKVVGLANVFVQPKTNSTKKVVHYKVLPKLAAKKVKSKVAKQKKSRKQKNKNNHIQFKPFRQLPSKGNYLGLYDAHIAIVVSNTSQYSKKKTNVLLKKLPSKVVFINTSFAVNVSKKTNYNTKKIHYSCCVFNTNYCRPPPVV